MKKSLFLLVLVPVILVGIWPVVLAGIQNEEMPPGISADVRQELEKLLSSEQAQQLEGAYNLGNMGENAVPAIPFLLEALQRYEGLVDVEEASLKYFEEDTAFLVFGGTASCINPVQMVATVALAKIGEPAIESLREALLKADPVETPFAYCAEALARMQDPETTKMLQNMMSSENLHVRSRIVQALSFSKDPSSVDVLIEALTDDESSVKEGAARSLEKITGQDFGEDAGKWQEWRINNKL